LHFKARDMPRFSEPPRVKHLNDTTSLTSCSTEFKEFNLATQRRATEHMFKERMSAPPVINTGLNTTFKAKEMPDFHKLHEMANKDQQSKVMKVTEAKGFSFKSDQRHLTHEEQLKKKLEQEKQELE
jgi:hypothetical protein